MNALPVAAPPFQQWRLLFLALDPLHIGTGGMTLGRVDMAIAREPGSNLPKIPGTGLSGAARSYAASRFDRPCAGQRGHCGERNCPVCYTFGSLKTVGDQQRTAAGTVNLFDAMLLFFPVPSASGPVWISTVDRLQNDAGFVVEADPFADDEIMLAGPVPKKGSLNLGWLLLGAKGGAQVTAPTGSNIPADQWAILAPRIALVSDKLFSQVVNSNLEVRTSVSIDPKTGAAEDGALFTYEAIPRATWLFSDAIEDDYRRRETDRPFPQTIDGTELKFPFDVAKAGLDQMRWLGIGGMGTRGFGRLRPLAHWTVTP